MKKRKSFNIIILSIIVIISLYFSVRLLLKLEISNVSEYIPIIVFIISVAFLISTILNVKNAKETISLKNRLNMWNSITYKVKKAGETAFNKLPIGIIVIDKNSKIVWSNQNAKIIFMSKLENINLEDISCPLYDKLVHALKEYNESNNDLDSITFNADIYGKIFYVEYLVKHNVMYFTDITNHEKLRTLYHNRTEVLGYINIDNLEETLQDFDAQTKAEYEGKIIGSIAKWADENGIFARALSSTRYILITDQEHLEKVIKTNFSILDDVKILFNTSRVVRITLSMGIACNDVNINNLSKEAEDQLELALSRGGDQVVVKKNNEVLYFGAKTDPIVKESKVEIRVKSEELTNLMSNSSSIFVIGHKNIDADGFAATVAMYKWAKKLGKNAYIIYDPESIDPTVEKIFKTIKAEYGSFMEAFITPNKIGKYSDKDSLLMVVDFQTKYQVVDQKIFNHFEKVGIIDHHRKGAGALENNKFYYSQASASSSVELIFELMSFMKEPVDFSELEATWMLLGIVVDTNNFVYRATSTTFDVASTLKKYGADMNIVKEYLKEDLEEKRARQQAISNVEIYKGKVAIAHTEDDVEVDRTTLAKISDELISIDKVELAITVGHIENNQIGLSARSLGKINSQIIMEKMGGGGHLNNAAAQRKDEKIDITIGILKEKLDSFLVEEENMKVILIKDLKGKGKKDDIIEVAAGYGNNLVRSQIAVIASPENMKALDEKKHQEAIKEAELLQEMKNLKEKIEKTEVKIKVKVGKEGKLFGSVSSKQVADAISNQLNVKMDKRKFDMDTTITSLGTYEIKIQLHKDVTAKIKLFVIEE